MSTFSSFHSAAGGHESHQNQQVEKVYMLVNAEQTLLILGLGVAIALFTELLSYVMIYRHEEFKKLHAECKKLWREYYEVEAACGAGADGRPAGRGGRLLEEVEKKIQRKTKQVATYRQKGNLVVGLILMVSMPIVYSCFDDSPAAYLPFSPIFPFSMVLRYSPSAAAELAASATTNGGSAAARAAEAANTPLCSAAGLFMLAMMMVRMNLQKLFGFAAPGSSQQQQKMFPFQGP